MSVGVFGLYLDFAVSVLGLCVGFSESGLMSWCLNFITLSYQLSGELSDTELAILLEGSSLIS